MGEVYRARDSRLGRDVAIKVLRSVNGNAGWRGSSEKVASLNHPHIAAIYGLEETATLSALDSLKS